MFYIQYSTSFTCLFFRWPFDVDDNVVVSSLYLVIYFLESFHFWFPSTGHPASFGRPTSLLSRELERQA